MARTTEEILLEVNVDTKQAEGSLGSLEDRLQELTEARNKIPIGTEDFDKLSREIQGIESDIKNVELQFEALDFEQQLTAGTDAVVGLAGGFAAAEGAMLLFGNESEALEETLRRVGGALALTSGLRDLANGVIAMRKFGLATKLATARQWALNVAMNANPIGLIIGLLAAITAAVLVYAAATSEASEEERKAAIQKEQLNKASRKAAESIVDEQVKLNSLLKVARDRNASDKARAEAVKQLNDLSPEYLGGLTTENVLTEQGTKLVNQYNEALKRKAMAQALEEELVELYKQRIQAQKDAQAGYIEETTVLGALGDSFGLMFGDQEKALENIAEKSEKGQDKIVAGLDEQIEVLTDLLAAEKEQELVIDSNTRAYEKRAKAIEQEKTELEKLLEARKKEMETVQKMDIDIEEQLEPLKKIAAAEQEQRDERIRQVQTTADIEKDIELRKQEQVAAGSREIYANWLAERRQMTLDTINAGFDASQNSLNALSELNDAKLQREIAGLEEGDAKRQQIEKQAFERGKKIQIAQAIISGLQGIVNIWSAASTIPQPADAIYRAVNTAALIATTAAQISKIKSTPFAGGGSVSGGQSGASAGGVGGAVQIGNISNTASLVDQQQQELTAQVVVLESDITSTQENVTTVSELSSF